MTPPIDRAPSEAAVPHRRPRDLRSAGRHDRSTPARPDAASGARGAMTTVEITLLGRFAVDGRRRRRGRGQLDAPSRRRAGQGARARTGPAPAPRAGHRPRLARGHPRRGRAEAAQGGPLRPARHRRRQRRRAARRQRRSLLPRTTSPSTSSVRGAGPPGPGRRGRRSPPTRRSPVYGGELLPEDRYDAWAEERREQLRLRHVDLLRLVGRWDELRRARPRRRARPTWR